MNLTNKDGSLMTFAQAQAGLRRGHEASYAAFRVTDDDPDEVVITTANSFVDFISDPAHLEVFISDDFTLNPVTGEITYTGPGIEQLVLSGEAVMDIGGFGITEVRIGISINNAAPVLQSAPEVVFGGKVTGVLAGPISLDTNDTFKVQLTADSTGTIEVFRFGAFIYEVEGEV